MDRPPRVRPALVAGVGAGGSLGAAALCILSFGAAIVAFVHWPDHSLAPRTDRVVVEPPARPPPHSARPAAGEPPRRALPAFTEAGPPPVQRRRAARPPRRPVPVLITLPGRPAQLHVAAPAPQPAPPPAPPAPPPTILRATVVAAAGELRARGRDAAALVGTVDKPTGELVGQVTDGAGDTVETVAALLP